MSHFTMLVAGEDYDYQLAPFHEFECTDLNDEFVQDIDRTAEYMEDFKTAKKNYKDAQKSLAANEITQEEFDQKTQYMFKGKTFLEYLIDYREFKYAESPEEAKTNDEFRYGYVYTDEGGTVRYINRTNPDAKWDWYCEGGRWDGLLTLKDGTKSNCARKGEIDFELMWKKELERLQNKYRTVINVLGGIPEIERTWKSFCDDKTLTWDERRELYHAQPVVKKFKESKEIEEAVGWMGSVDDFICTEEEYVENHSPYSLTFGFVVNREWHEKAEMGWWAATSNEKEPTSWNKEYKDFIDSLPDDTLLTVIDCHI